MKKWLTGALALTMSATVLLSGGCGGGDTGGWNAPMEGAPDYSAATGEFLTYAYSPPTDGTWWIDSDNKNDNVDYRTYENYVIYKDAGLNTLLQQSARFDGGDFETSVLKRVMDDSLRAGIARTIVWDTRIWGLSNKSTAIVGSGCQFETHDALVQQVGEWMADYKDHEAFYGVMLIDEPTWQMLPQVGEVYKAVKEAAAAGGYEVFVQENLLPIYADNDRLVDTSVQANKDLSKREKYRKYLVDFLTYSEADRLCMDSYPIRQNAGENNYSITTDHFLGLQVLAEVCKEYGIKLTGVACTTAMVANLSGEPTQGSLKGPNRSEMYWQVNSYLGFGVDSLSYYTYWRKQQNSAAAFHTDGTAFVYQNGTPTDLYYSMQKIHAEIQKLAPTMMNFKYQGANYYLKTPLSWGSKFVDNIEQDNFTALLNVEVKTAQLAIATELYDEDNDQYMYMLMNPQHPSNGFTCTNDEIVLNGTMDFGSDYKAVAVWLNGELSYRPLTDGKITFNLGAGMAAFVMPY